MHACSKSVTEEGRKSLANKEVEEDGEEDEKEKASLAEEEPRFKQLIKADPKEAGKSQLN